MGVPLQLPGPRSVPVQSGTHELAVGDADPGALRNRSGGHDSAVRRERLHEDGT